MVVPSEAFDISDIRKTTAAQLRTFLAPTAYAKDTGDVPKENLERFVEPSLLPLKVGNFPFLIALSLSRGASMEQGQYIAFFLLGS